MTMEMQYFVYTRNNIHDYGLMFSPSDSLCPKETRKDFLKEARGVINTEKYNSCLDKPTWLLIKIDDLVLFGVGINNKELNAETYIDAFGRPVRGFFGIVAKAEELTSLPGLEFFKDFYAKKLCPLWNNPLDDFSQKGINVECSDAAFESLPTRRAEIELNTDVNKSVAFPADVDKNDLFALALACSGRVSVVAGLEEKAHAFDEKYKYMNSIVSGCSSIETKEYQPANKETDVWGEFPETTGQGQEEMRKKKEMRMMLIAAIAFLAILATVLILLRMLLKK